MDAKTITETMERYLAWWSSRYAERIYGIAFYSTSMLSYAGCTVFTKEGLENISGGNFTKTKDEDDRLPDFLENELKWSPCDSPHHMENEEIFETLNAELSEKSKELYELEDDEFEHAINKEYEIILEGLREFRAQLPETGREKVVVTMMWGDISPDEQIRFVASCNSEAVTEAFQKEYET